MTSTTTFAGPIFVSQRSTPAPDPFAGHDLGPMTPVRKAVWAEFARRVAPAMSVIMEGTQWLRDLEAQAVFENEASANIRRLFTLLFDDDSLIPSELVAFGFDEIAVCLELVPLEDRQFLADFVDNTVASASALRAAREQP